MTDKQKTPEELQDISAAYAKRRILAVRLADQDRYIGDLVRTARTKEHTWAAIAEAAGTSDVAVIKAARRKK